MSSSSGETAASAALAKRLRQISLVSAGMLAAGLPAFFLLFLVWPEIVVPAYFVSRGGLLYETVTPGGPHTPLLILILAASGKVFGFSAVLFRSVSALSMAACGALLVLGVRPARKGLAGPLAGLLIGVPLFVLWAVYMEGPTIWPEPFMAPLLLGAVLALERYETTGKRSTLIGAGLLLGAAILVKQTAAWTILSALLWILLASRRRSARMALSLFAVAAAPYLVFAVGWAALFQTFSHIRWTLVIPVLGGFAGDVATGIHAKDLLDGLSLFLIFPAIFLLARGLPGHRFRSPATWVAIGAYGMAWPRWGLLHLAAAAGVVSLIAARAWRIAPPVIRRWRRQARRRERTLAPAAGAALLASHTIIAFLAGGAVFWAGRGGPAFWWDDPSTASLARMVRDRVGNGSFLNVCLAAENLYAITGTETPDGTYVNANFWYLLNRENVGDRLVSSLSRRPGTLILFREPGELDWRLRETSLYRFVVERTEVIERIDPVTTWRVVR